MTAAAASARPPLLLLLLRPTAGVMICEPDSQCDCAPSLAARWPVAAACYKRVVAVSPMVEKNATTTMTARSPRSRLSRRRRKRPSSLPAVEVRRKLQGMGHSSASLTQSISVARKR